MAAEKLARFTLQPGGVDYGKEGKREGQRHIYTFFGRSPGRPLQEITSVVRRFIGRPTHSFSAGSVARKNSSNDGCGGGGGELACCMRRRFACQCLSIQTYSRPHCPSGIFGLPELHYYSFWHQIPLLLPPSFASRQTDGRTAGLALGSHVASSSGGNNLFPARQCADDTR